MGSKKKTEERAVILGIEHVNGRKSIVFGYTRSDMDGSTIKIRSARKAVRWSAETRGVFGLATTGPKPGSRITAPTDLEYRNMGTPGGSKVNLVMYPTAAAIEQWEKGIWS